LNNDAFSYVERLKSSQDRSDVTGFGSFDNRMCRRVLNLLEMVYSGLREVVLKRIPAI